VASTGGLVGFTAYELSEPIAEWLDKAPRDLRIVERKVRSWGDSVGELSTAIERLEKLGQKKKTVTVVEVDAGGPVSRLLSHTWQTVIGFFLTLLLLYFFLARGDSFLGKLVDLTPSFKNKKRIVDAFREIESRVSGYLLAITAINAMLGVSVGLAMWLLDMPNPTLWGVAAAFLNFVPYLGALTGIVIIAFVSLVTFDATSAILAPPAVYLLLTSLEGSVLTPTILGKTLSLSPVAVFIALLFWGWMWGVFGVAIAVPLLIAFKIGCDSSERTAPLAHLLTQ
jgi:predicted PurR-regulated permease PerM